MSWHERTLAKAILITQSFLLGQPSEKITTSYDMQLLRRINAIFLFFFLGGGLCQFCHKRTSSRKSYKSTFLSRAGSERRNDSATIIKMGVPKVYEIVPALGCLCLNPCLVPQDHKGDT